MVHLPAGATQSVQAPALCLGGRRYGCHSARRHWRCPRAALRKEKATGRTALPCLALPGRAGPRLAIPCLACRAQPRRAKPRPALPCQAPPALPIVQYYSAVADARPIVNGGEDGGQLLIILVPVAPVLKLRPRPLEYLLPQVGIAHRVGGAGVGLLIVLNDADESADRGSVFPRLWHLRNDATDDVPRLILAILSSGNAIVPTRNRDAAPRPPVARRQQRTAASGSRCWSPGYARAFHPFLALERARRPSVSTDTPW